MTDEGPTQTQVPGTNSGDPDSVVFNDSSYATPTGYRCAFQGSDTTYRE